MSHRPAAIVLVALALGCQSFTSPDLDAHTHGELLEDGLLRESGSGPYVAGSLESFRANVLPGWKLLRWSASAGTLNTSERSVSWKLPPAGVAKLTAVVRDPLGVEQTLSWDFQIVDSDDELGRAREALQAAPAPVVSGSPGPSGTTGSFCDLAYDATNKLHLAFSDDTHPGLWYGVWNGTTWTVEFVEGMGFNTGGQVGNRFAMVLDPSGVPHFAYSLSGRGVWYATRNGSSWVREQVDTGVQSYSSGRISLALNTAQSNRPTIVYENYLGSYLRTTIAARTAPATWTNTSINFASSSGTHQRITGDVLFASNGTLYIPYVHSSSTQAAYLGAWDGSTAAHMTLNNSSNLPGLNADWASAAWSGPNKLLLRTYDAVYEVTLGLPLSACSFFHSVVEATGGSSVGDVAFGGGKPYLLHLHGSNLELVTTGAGNYWAYTQLGTASTSAMPSLAVNAAGNPSICYQSGGKIYFQ